MEYFKSLDKFQQSLEESEQVLPECQLKQTTNFNRVLTTQNEVLRRLDSHCSLKRIFRSLSVFLTVLNNFIDSSRSLKEAS